MARVVTVLCAMPGGLHLRLFEMRPEPDTGVKKAFFTGNALQLKEGRNVAIDADFMEAWFEQNRQDNDLVTGNFVSIERASPQ